MTKKTFSDHSCGNQNKNPFLLLKKHIGKDFPWTAPPSSIFTASIHEKENSYRNKYKTPFSPRAIDARGKNLPSIAPSSSIPPRKKQCILFHPSCSSSRWHRKHPNTSRWTPILSDFRPTLVHILQPNRTCVSIETLHPDSSLHMITPVITELKK